MEQYPDYHFTQSQAQLYEYAKIHYPALYEKMKKWIKAGKWDVTGSMWVEADCNVTSGESLVRQIMFGKGFYQDEFDVDTDILWLPDVFGYSAALPQILKKSGVDYFTTIKISWNQFNKFPYHSFYWYGIDGTPVMAHFPPSNDYNARILPSCMKGSMEAYKERDRAEDALLQFGFGDGGGGPTKMHLENAMRVKNLEGIPRSHQGTASSFFKRLEANSSDLPVWRGELYLELHRGTYTTQAKNKRNNRKAEYSYRDAEFFGAADMAFGGKYPSKEMHEGWKIILRNQFHDVIPGSSVRAVYDDSDAQYAEAFSMVKKAREGNLSSLVNRIDTSGEGEAIVVFNSLSWDRKGPVSVELPDGTDKIG
jgi:alpha-mannosidase